MIWALYLLFLAGGLTGCGQVVRTWWRGRRAAQPVQRDPRTHERLP